jgi:cyclic pyranopterin phosphate synthase
MVDVREDITDRFGRKFEKLRVSLINECNFACTYCVSDDTNGRNHLEPNINIVPHQKRLNTKEFIEAITLVHDIVTLKSIRLTGGEPLLYPDLVGVIREIKLMGIDDIRLTTNAYYLKNKSVELKQNGLRAINISLDAVDGEIFRMMSGNQRMQRVLDGVDDALDAGLDVKLNAVIMKGKNDGQIIPLLLYAGQKGIDIRYLELMKMGHLFHHMDGYFFSQQNILDVIQSIYSITEVSRKKSSTSNYWNISGIGNFGIIANESVPFCGDCNRLRMDSFGNFYGCLSSSVGIPLMKESGNREKTVDSLKRLLSYKQSHHFKGNEMTMRYIGG